MEKLCIIGLKGLLKKAKKGGALREIKELNGRIDGAGERREH